MKKGGPGRPGRRSPVWSDELADAFLAILRDTGNAQAAIRALGHGDMFYRRRREDPDFARRWAQAADGADRDLSAAREARQGPFPAAPERAPAPPGPEPLALPGPAAMKASAGEPVIRRNRAGRLQLALTREGGWNSDVEARFLAHLRRSGAFLAAARAVGFHFTSIYERMRQWPAFARAVDEALDEAELRLEYALIGHAHALLSRPGEPREDGEDGEDGEEEVPFDPAMAMRILAFIDARRGGRTMRGNRRGPPERPFGDAVESILAKLDAMDRHDAWLEKRRAEGGGAPDDPAPPGGDGG